MTSNDKQAQGQGMDLGRVISILETVKSGDEHFIKYCGADEIIHNRLEQTNQAIRILTACQESGLSVDEVIARLKK